MSPLRSSPGEGPGLSPLPLGDTLHALARRPFHLLTLGPGVHVPADALEDGGGARPSAGCPFHVSASSSPDGAAVAEPGAVTLSTLAEPGAG